jgi:hypothetical protein
MFVKIASRSFENVIQFIYVGMTVTHQNLIQEEINRRLNSGNACYYLAQNLLSSRLLSTKNVNIRIYRTIILAVVLYGCETWSLTLREERDEVTGGWRKLHNEELHNLYSSSNIIRMITSKRMRWTRHVACLGRMHTRFL